MAGKTKKSTPRKTDARTTKNKKNSNMNSRGAWMLVSAIISALLIIFMYIDSSGMVNGAVKDILKGLFGKTAYIIPVVSVILTFYFVNRKDTRRFKIKTVISILVLINLSSLVHLMSREVGSVAEAYRLGIEGTGGGFLGAITAYGLYVLFRRTASIVILFFILIVLCSLVTRVSLISAAYTFIKGLFSEVKNEAGEIKQVDATEKAVNIKREIKSKRVERNQDELIDIPLTGDELSQDMPGKIKKQSKNDDLPIDIDIPNVKAEDKPEFADVNVNVVEMPEDIETEIKSTGLDEELNKVDEILNDINSVENESFDDIFRVIPDNDFPQSVPEDVVEMPEMIEQPEKTSTLTEEEKYIVNSEIDEALFEEKREYVFPGVELLATPKNQNTDMREEMRETAAKLIQTLKSFHVEAKLLQVTKGPSVTRYEIQLEAGTKFAKVEGLSKDIALNLASQNVLIAPVPGKAAIGIEVPNKEVASVYARELIESEEFKNAKSKISFALGKDISGRVIVGDLAKMPHMLIAGTTGSGKSVCTNTIITSFLYKASPDEVKLIMIDPKKVEFNVYKDIPHLLIPVVTDPKRAAAALNWATQEMDKRYTAFTDESVKNIQGYNERMEEIGGKKMPQIVIVIDELADLMMVAAKEVEGYIVRLTQLARAAGIHLIIATQRPSVDVVTGLIKANMPSRIALLLSSQVDSRTVIDRGGAEKLLGNGDMLYAPVGSRTPLRVQGAYISEKELENIVNFLKETSEPNTFSEDLAEHIERHALGENGVTPDEEDDGDSLLPQAIELAVSMGQISTSMIQRKFRIGYSRAGRIIDQMEQRGIVSGPNGSKPREVLVGNTDLM